MFDPIEAQASLAQDAYLRRGPDCSRELPTRNRRWMYSSDAWQRSWAGGPTELSARNTNSARRYRSKGVNDLRHLAFCHLSHSQFAISRHGQR